MSSVPHVLIATLRLVRAVALGAVRQSVGRGRAHVVSVGIEYISNANTLRRAKIRCEASFGTYSHTYSTLRANSHASCMCIVDALPRIELSTTALHMCNLIGRLDWFR